MNSRIVWGNVNCRDSIIFATALNIDCRPGATVRDGTLTANVDFPGLAIRYTLDGSEPDKSSKNYDGPISASGTVKLRTFDSRGRGSRTSESMPSSSR